jgi:uncharacterized protein YndB with AHSA1/START domain
MIHVEASRTVDAPPDEVYQFLVDYRTKHPSILPRASFVGYTVEEGGTGAGTVISFRVRAGGRERPYRMRISEPEPGRILQEQDTMSSLVTSFTLTPVAGNAQTNVTIETQWQGGSGIGGFMERTFAPMAMRRIYANELDLLAAAVKSSVS